jgi:hypothetical protein
VRYFTSHEIFLHYNVPFSLPFLSYCVFESFLFYDISSRRLFFRTIQSLLPFLSCPKFFFLGDASHPKVIFLQCVTHVYFLYMQNMPFPLSLSSFLPFFLCLLVLCINSIPCFNSILYFNCFISTCRNSNEHLITQRS